MKMVFLDIVSVTPDDRNWVTLSNDDNVRVMRSRNDTVNIPGMYSYIAVTTFNLKTSPSKAYNFLMRHLVEVQVHGTPYSVSEKQCYSHMFFCLQEVL